MKRIFPEIERLDRIYHLADIHIRNNYKRWDEYLYIIGRFSEYVKQQNADNAIIVIAGDIVHSKLNITPELISCVSEFIYEMIALHPTIITIGNHDLNLYNKHRLDALTPIVELINDDKLYFSKHTEDFIVGDSVFHHMSLIDSPEKYKKGNAFPYDKKRFAIFHGPVGIPIINKSGYRVKANQNISSFNGYDIALLGDIHEHQFLQYREVKVFDRRDTVTEDDLDFGIDVLDDRIELRKPTIVYPGSFIQQTFGEGINHGFVIHDLETWESEFIQLDNPKSMIIVPVEKSVVKLPAMVPENPRVRIDFYDTQQDVNGIASDIKLTLNASSVAINHQSSIKDINKSDVFKESDEVKNLITSPELLIESIIGSNNPIKKDILELHRKYANLHKERKPETYTISYLKFKNLFSYKSTNEIFFDEINGVTGIFGANAIGKSSVVDIIMFMLHDRTSRSYRTVDILNHGSNAFEAELHIKDTKGNLYVIKKHGRLQSSGRLPVHIDFLKISPDGEITNLTGEDRRFTAVAIKEQFGSYEDFQIINLYNNISSINFIDLSQTERKQYLANYLKLNVYNDILKEVREDFRDIKSQIKVIKSADPVESIDRIVKEIDEIQQNIDRLENQKSNLDDYIQSLTTEIQGLNSQIQPIPSIEENIDIDTLVQQRESIEQEIQSLQERQGFLQKEINALEEEIQSTDLKNFEDQINALKEIESELRVKESSRNHITKTLKSIESRLQSLESNIEEYNPDCEVCVSRVSKDIQLKESLEQEWKELKKDIDELNAFIDEHNDVSKKLNDLLKQKNGYDKRISRLNELKRQLDIIPMQIESKKREFDEIQNKINQYNLHQDILIQNHEIQSQIDIKQKELNESNRINDSIYKELIDRKASLKYHLTELSKLNEMKNRLVELERQAEIYDAYVKVLQRIPSVVINTFVKTMEDIINVNLSYHTKFSVKLEMDESDNINVFINYPNGSWPAELASGYERFMINMSIKLSLYEISPTKLSFFAIDEAFSVADSDHIFNVYEMISYLGKRFKNVIVITHIDNLKDVVDNVVKIKSENNISFIEGISELV